MMKAKKYKKILIFLYITIFVGIGLIIFGLAGTVYELTAAINDLQPTKEPEIQPIPPVKENPNYVFLKEREINI